MTVRHDVICDQCLKSTPLDGGVDIPLKWVTENTKHYCSTFCADRKNVRRYMKRSVLKMGPHKMMCKRCKATAPVPEDSAPIVRFYRIPDDWSGYGDCGCAE